MKKMIYRLLIVVSALANAVHCFAEEALTYLCWDNCTPASIDDLELDPLLILRVSSRYSDHSDSLRFAWQRAADFASCNFEEGAPRPFEENVSADKPSLHVINTNSIFYTSPAFHLAAQNANYEKIWWQISSTPDFANIPSSLDSIQKGTDTIKLSDLDETFLAPGKGYYFRAKGYSHGTWGEWCTPFPFSCEKPATVENIQIEMKTPSSFELCWDGLNGPDISYYVFGSNSLDFIPSVYSHLQPDVLLGAEIVEASATDNFLGETTATNWLVNGQYAYYRVIAQRHGQLSTPSQVIRFWENGNAPVGNVLKLELSAEDADITFRMARRVAIPSSYSWMQMRESDPASDNIYRYVQNPYVTQQVWNELQPYFLPENHPVKSLLDLVFQKQRALKSLSALKKAGFKPIRKPENDLVVARHRKMKGYLIKAYLDKVDEDESYWFLRRVTGARQVQQCIDNHGYNPIMKAPQKWIYPLPPEPSPAHKRKVWRKDFILVVEDVQPLKYKKNKSAYKKRVTTEILDALYTVFTENLLVDSFFLPNIAFCKDGKIAFLDTEFYNDDSRPLKLWKLAQYLSSDMHAYWDQLIQHGVPNN